MACPAEGPGRGRSPGASRSAPARRPQSDEASAPPDRLESPRANRWRSAGILEITQCTHGGGLPAPKSAQTTASSFVPGRELPPGQRRRYVPAVGGVIPGHRLRRFHGRALDDDLARNGLSRNLPGNRQSGQHQDSARASRDDACASPGLRFMLPTSVREDPGPLPPVPASFSARRCLGSLLCPSR